MKRQIHRQGSRVSRKKIVAGAMIFAALSAATAWLVFEGPWYASLAQEEARLFYDEHIAPRVSSMMRLDRVKWEEQGSSNLSARVTVPLLEGVSGLTMGQEMLLIDLDDLEKRLMAVPWIESVHIQKQLPSTLSIQYSVHQARALGVRKGHLWLVSSKGRWIAPLGEQQAPSNDSRAPSAPLPAAALPASGLLDNPEQLSAVRKDRPESLFDLPVLVNEDAIDTELSWLDAIEAGGGPRVGLIHEISVASPSGKMRAVFELQYPDGPKKVSILGLGQPDSMVVSRLRQVVEYLAKNQILISNIDVRPAKRVVVRVGR